MSSSSSRQRRSRADDKENGDDCPEPLQLSFDDGGHPPKRDHPRDIAAYLGASLYEVQVSGASPLAPSPKAEADLDARSMPYPTPPPAPYNLDAYSPHSTTSLGGLSDDFDEDLSDDGVMAYFTSPSQDAAPEIETPLRRLGAASPGPGGPVARDVADV